MLGLIDAIEAVDAIDATDAHHAIDAIASTLRSHFWPEWRVTSGHTCTVGIVGHPVTHSPLASTNYWNKLLNLRKIDLSLAKVANFSTRSESRSEAGLLYVWVCATNTNILYSFVLHLK